MNCDCPGHRARTIAHAEGHPSGDKELLIHAVTQAGVLAGGAAVELVVCASMRIAGTRIAMHTTAMSLGSIYDSLRWLRNQLQVRRGESLLLFC